VTPRAEEVDGADIIAGTVTTRQIVDHTILGKDVAGEAIGRKKLKLGVQKALARGGPTGATGPNGTVADPGVYHLAVELIPSSLTSPATTHIQVNVVHVLGPLPLVGGERVSASGRARPTIRP
jgi:hypothetical protein